MVQKLSIDIWIPSPYESKDGTKLWMTPTPTNHGLVIRHPDLGGPIPDETELSPRRFSAILQVADKYYLQVGSIAYQTGYDSFNPNEPFKKYINGEFQVLMGKIVNDPDEAFGWSGMAQDLV